MTLNLTVPATDIASDFQPRITVIGVGGGGCNAVNNMIASELEGIDFIVANTDAQSLLTSRADRRIQLGLHKTQGLGAGARPEVGREAAEEALGEIETHLAGVHMLFITAGMGGGTGTGAAPVIARMARERGVLTVGVVTKPFDFEGPKRRRVAEAGIEELQQFVDTLIVIPNQNLFRLATEKTTFAEAFKMADNVLHMGVRGVTDLIVRPGLVNLDFADIRTVMSEMGKAMMGTGEAEGEKRAEKAAEAAISNPLLDDTSVKGARGVLINITGGQDVGLFEIDEAANRIRKEVEQGADGEANIIFGAAIDETMNGRIRVSVVATGIDAASMTQTRPERVLHVVGNTARVMHAQPAPMPRTAPQPVAMAAQPAPVAAPMASAQAAAQHIAYAEPQAAPAVIAEPAAETAPVQAAMPAPAPAPAPAPHAPIHQARPQPSYAQAPAPAPAPVAGPVAAPVTAPVTAHPGTLFDGQQRAAQPGPAPQRGPLSRLFRNATGLGRAEPQAAAPQPVPAPQPAPAYTPAPAPAARSLPEAPRPATRRPAAEDDLGLDIPTFLRRQAN